MPAFIVSPTPKSERIPVITLEELATALRAYLPTVYDFSYLGEGLDASDGETMVTYHGNDKANKRYKLEVTLIGKVARSWQSKLFKSPFDISVYEQLDDFGELMKLKPAKMLEVRQARTRYLLITPLVDRSILIKRILRWENGRPVLAD